MSSTMAGTDVRNGIDGLTDDALAGAERVRDAAGQEVNRLIADVEDLVKKVARVSDADIARVRQRVERTLAVTKESVQRNAARVNAGAKQAAVATDNYVHERPWTALGIAAAVGVVLGMLSTRR